MEAIATTFRSNSAVLTVRGQPRVGRRQGLRGGWRLQRRAAPEEQAVRCRVETNRDYLIVLNYLVSTKNIYIYIHSINVLVLIRACSLAWTNLDMTYICIFCSESIEHFASLHPPALACCALALLCRNRIEHWSDYGGFACPFMSTLSYS